MASLRPAARLIVVAFFTRQLVLDRSRQYERRIQMLVLDNRRLIDLPDLVEQAVGKGMLPVPNLQRTVQNISFP